MTRRFTRAAGLAAVFAIGLVRPSFAPHRCSAMPEILAVVLSAWTFFTGVQMLIELEAPYGETRSKFQR
jgi:hypothetical protein